MNDNPALEAANQSSKIGMLKQRIKQRIKQLPARYKNWRTKKMLKQIVKWNDGNLVAHAKRELSGLKPDADEMDAYRANQIVELIAVFSSHWHSGFSARFATNLFSKLSAYKPLCPLTGKDDEWTLLDYDEDMVYQNKRASHVFKRADGTAYDSTGKVYRTLDGCSYTDADSRVDVTFPYTPVTEYVDVEEDE